MENLKGKTPVTETFRFDGYNPETNHFYRDLDGIRLVYEPAWHDATTVELVGWYRPETIGED